MFFVTDDNIFYGDDMIRGQKSIYRIEIKYS